MFYEHVVAIITDMVLAHNDVGETEIHCIFIFFLCNRIWMVEII